jgi:phosphoglycolate phosphatase-like HAD superfamily hydrolase
MNLRPRNLLLSLAVWIAGAVFAMSAFAQSDPLPSWNDGATKQAIVDFVAAVTKEGGPDYVAPDRRIATFDNDGTLWVEHPMYTQLAFALDRIRALAPDHPEWKDTEPFRSVIAGDTKGIVASGKKGLEDILAVTHAGMSTADFEAIVTDWFAEAEHPRFKKPYTDLAYKPMLELLAYLRANGFKTFIVSGGGIEFMRPMTDRVYGIPSEQVIGSSIVTKFEMQDGKPVLMRLPKINFIDDKDGKPVGINQYIGKRPIAAFGNSGGDREMLEWTGAGDGKHLMMLVFHDDAEREYAYGPANGLPDTHFGAFPQSLMEEAGEKGWTVISMKNDWEEIFSFGE